MAFLPIKPLDSADGYLRWKESVLLRLHTVGVAHVLSDDPPAPAGDDGVPGAAAAAKKWERDDAVCRGHILAALSDRILPDYARHATGRALWRAVARTYDVEASFGLYPRSYDRFLYFQFDEGAPLPEQLAHAEALAATKDPPLSDFSMAHNMCIRLPEKVALIISNGDMTMDRVWRAVLRNEERRIEREDRELRGTVAREAQEPEGKAAHRRRRQGHL
ncbi:hypothetical protein ACP70R_000884 [Stipagrostis hirtigluma subsp. patula]